MYEGSLDRAFTLQILPMYDPEFRQYLRSKNQEDDAPSGKTKFIIIETPDWGSHSIPDSVWKKSKLHESNKHYNFTEENLNRRLTIINNTRR